MRVVQMIDRLRLVGGAERLQCSFASLRRARALRRFLAEERFDVLHTHLVRSTILGGAVARMLAIYLSLPGVGADEAAG